MDSAVINEVGNVKCRTFICNMHFAIVDEIADVEHGTFVGNVNAASVRKVSCFVCDSLAGE